MSHVPLWFAQFPKSRRHSYPRVRGEHTTRVVIVGGGLTGAACALACAAAGLDPILLEADAIGGGMTAGDSGLLREGFAGSFEEAARSHGLRTARNLWEGLRRGSLDFAAALRRYKIRGDLEPKDVLSLARPGEDAGRLLRREYDARRRAGVEGTWVMSAAVARETAIVSAGAMRTRGAAFDPYRACLGMAAAAESRGARLHEKSEVKRIRSSQHHVDVQTAGATVRADIVVIATGAPIQDLRAIRRHIRPVHAYGVVTASLPAPMRRSVGQRSAVMEDAAGEGRIIRWIDGDRIFVHGGRQPAVADRARERAITQRTGQMMYELSLLYPAISGLPAALSWDGVDHDTADGLPLVGPHRNFPRHLFALGSSRHGAGLAWTAARLVLRHIQGEPAKSDEAFGFGRRTSA
ncbi:MAG: FAD-binding oxidoreductase [Acidobacteriota bacterium]|nr:FAD-binding oxidoreductase [Acidobacteriota bacterium]